MKKLYSALGILLAITGFCWFTAWRVDDLCNTSASLLEAAETQVMLGDYDAAVETVNHSFRLWNRHEGFFGMALRHTESDDVGDFVSGAPGGLPAKGSGRIFAPGQRACRQSPAPGTDGAAVFV